jgi:ABC-type methionine transport system permease subunit
LPLIIALLGKCTSSVIDMKTEMVLNAAVVPEEVEATCFHAFVDDILLRFPESVIETNQSLFSAATIIFDCGARDSKKSFKFIFCRLCQHHTFTHWNV